MRSEPGIAVRRMWLGLLAIGLALAALPAVAQATELTPTNLPLTGSNFQGGDGNQNNPTAPADASNPAPFPTTIDWQALAASPGLETLNDGTGASDDVYVSGKEDTPLDWNIGTGQANPGKADLLANWTFFDDDAEGPFLYLAVNRLVNLGNTFLAFELNQDRRLWRNANGDLIQCRTDGDLIISYEIQNSNNINVVAQTWDSLTSVSAGEAAGGLTNGQGCAKTGTFTEDPLIPDASDAQAAINSAGTITNFLPRTPAAATFGQGLFGEAALRIAEVLNPGNPDACFSFGRLNMYSRSSGSDQSNLIDVTDSVEAVVRQCTISGTKFADDGDGVPEGEPGIEGYVVYLDLDHDNAFTAGEPTATTDEDGEYVFNDVATANYEIREAPDSMQLPANQGLTCTFPVGTCENTAQIDPANGLNNDTGNDFGNVPQGQVVVKKETQPDGSSQAFTFDPGTGLSPTDNFALTDGGQKAFSVVPGTYTVAELAETGWDLASISCTDPNGNNSSGDLPTRTATFNVAAGETVTCTFNNTQQASLTIVKQATPEGPTTFDFDPTGTGMPGDIDLVDDGTAANTQTINFNSSQLGVKTVIENVPGGWDLTSAICGGDATDDDPAQAAISVDIEAGDNVTCTFNNSEAASLAIVKQATPEGSTSFDFDPTGTGMPGDIDLVDDGTVANTQTINFDSSQLGVKTLLENVPGGWNLTSATCSGDATDDDPAQAAISVDIEAGDNVTCTFSNSRQTGTITVVKDLNPSGDPGRFDLQIDGTTRADDVGDGGTTPAVTVDEGNHTVGEIAGAGTDLADYQKSIACSGGEATTGDNGGPLTVNVSDGENVVCAITNVREELALPAPLPPPRKRFCSVEEPTIRGTQGPDKIVGTPGNDVIKGRGGDDVINGKGGHDLICPNKGDDIAKGNGGRDTVRGGPDDDKLNGGPGSDFVHGYTGDDIINGGKDKDACRGGTGETKRISCEGR